MGRTACTEPQCPYKGDLYLYCPLHVSNKEVHHQEVISVHAAYTVFMHVCDVSSLIRYGSNHLHLVGLTHIYIRNVL